MDFTVSRNFNTVCIDDSGIKVTWERFFPWKSCGSVGDALQGVVRGRIESTAKLDANHTLAMLTDASSDGAAVVISDNNGATDARWVILGPKVYRVLFETLDGYSCDVADYLQRLQDDLAKLENQEDDAE